VSRAVHAVSGRIGIFGGSFDPVHVGHLIVAAEAARALHLSEIRLVPVREHPFKQGRHAAGAEQRLAMARLAVAEDPRFVVDDRECRRPGPSYTIDTLRALRAEMPTAELFLLLGSDSAQQLSAWRDAQVVPTLATVVELTRPGAEPSRQPGVVRTLEVPAIDVSATVLRERVRRGESIRYFVPDAVAAYIAAHGLYRNEG
jgi:nicotinate-nucleotide adenylyltransferase